LNAVLDIVTITPGHDQRQNPDQNKFVNTSARWWRGGSMTGRWMLLSSKVKGNSSTFAFVLQGIILQYI